jgi:transposase
MVGLDVHSKVIVACYLTTDEVTNESRHECAEFTTFKSGLRELAKWIKERGSPPAIMESTGIYWKGPRQILFNNGIKCIVVNARHIKKVPGHKTDIADSLWLAMVGRAGLVKNSFVPTPKFEKIRRLARLRQQINDELSRTKNRLHKILTECGILLSNVITDINGQSGRAMIEAIAKGMPPMEALQFASTRLKASPEDILRALDTELDDEDLFLIRSILQHVKQLEEKIRDYDRFLSEMLKEYQWALDLLQTIPGVDFLASAMIIAEIGLDMDEFGTADRLSSWAGMCPGNNESAGKRKATTTNKGNRYLRRILCEVANAASRTKSCYFEAKFKSLCIRRGRKRAIVAIGHNILRIMFYMLKRREVYRDSVIDYKSLVVKKNASRWIMNLRQFGYLKTSESGEVTLNSQMALK